MIEELKWINTHRYSMQLRKPFCKMRKFCDLHLWALLRRNCLPFFPLSEFNAFCSCFIHCFERRYKGRVFVLHIYSYLCFFCYEKLLFQTMKFYCNYWELVGQNDWWNIGKSVWDVSHRTKSLKVCFGLQTLSNCMPYGSVKVLIQAILF